MFALAFCIIPIVNVEADDDIRSIGNTTATIKGNNYEFDEVNRIIILSSNASVELTGDAKDYRIVVKEDAKDVSIVLNNYTADEINDGYNNSNKIELKNGSSARVTLIGENHLKAGFESSAIRVPVNTSLVIDGDGSLYAQIYNGEGNGASSAVIGSQYENPFGSIIINSGNIYTSFSGSGVKTGIGAGYWSTEEEMSGTITLNGGNIHTDVLGSVTDRDKVSLKGNGNAFLYTDSVEAIYDDFNGVIFNENGNVGTVMGNVVLNQDMNIPDGTVLTVSEGASLTIPQGVTVTNDGNIVNKGTINNTGNLQNSGAIENDGSITSTTEVDGVTGNKVKVVLYNVVVKHGIGGTIDHSKSFTVKHGENITFNILPDKGYKIKSVIVNNEDKTSEVIDGKLDLLNISEDIVINVQFEKIPYVSGKANVIDNNIENPQTYDDILFYIRLEMVSLIGLALVSSYIKKSYCKTR